MGDEDRQALLTLLRTLADETRLRILGILAAKEHSVDELASLLQLKALTVSHHLAKLKEGLPVFPSVRHRASISISRVKIIPGWRQRR